MEKQNCLNVTSDDQNYSSPMPIIGLYIVAGTFVCVLFMVCDLFHGLSRRKPWIPCRFFSLNSLTLALLAISSKLPVDLTTPMPSVYDQLSKLSGSVLICISMCFFFPSVRTQSESEYLSNMISLSILVVAVVVNVSMQILTGVIFLFRDEHITIMSFMLLLLVFFWFASDFLNSLNITPTSNPVDELTKKVPQNSENKSMIHKLKSFYHSSSEHNPEFPIITSPTCLAVCMLSILSALILSQAAVRSIVLKSVEFRSGVSNYKWSIWIVVATQMFTVLVGSIVSIFRCLLALRSAETETNVFTVLSTLSKFHSFCTWFLSTLSELRIISFFKSYGMGFFILLQTIESDVALLLFVLQVIIYMLAYLLYWMLKIPFMCAKQISRICFGEKRNSGDITDKQWIQGNCEEDINRWIDKYKRNPPLDNLIQLLSKTPQSGESFTNKVSCLSVVIFIRIATMALPNALSASLIRTLDEAFEIIYFIEKKEISTSEEKSSHVLAKKLWMNKSNKCHWFHKDFIKPSVDKFIDGNFQRQHQPILDLHCALRRIKNLKERCDVAPICKFQQGYYAVDIIKTICEMIISQRQLQMYSTIDGLYKHMEKLFVYMLHFFLSQLPLAIFKHLVESPIQEREERARLVLKFLYKLEPLENKVHWSFPDEIGITSLINTQVPIIDTQSTEQVEGNVDVDPNAASRAIDGDEIEELV